MKKLTAEKTGFTHGVVYAVAQLIRFGSGHVDALWRESGFSLDDLDICDDYDANEVRDYFQRNS